jgi:Flp pilus assembly pilin Flp
MHRSAAYLSYFFWKNFRPSLNTQDQKKIKEVFNTMYSKFNIFSSRQSKGAGLAEYGILVGLISVVSIGAVIELGEETKSIFSTTEHALVQNLELAGPADETPTGAADPEMPEAPDDGTTSWSIEAQEQSRSGQWAYRGYSSYHSTPFGKRNSNTGSLELLSLYISHSDSETKISFSGDTRSIITDDMFVRCDGYDDVHFSGASVSMQDDSTRTLYRFSGHRIPFTSGSTYNCSLVNPDAT